MLVQGVVHVKLVASGTRSLVKQRLGVGVGAARRMKHITQESGRTIKRSISVMNEKFNELFGFHQSH